MVDDNMILQYHSRQSLSELLVSKIMSRQFNKVESDVSIEKVKETLKTAPYVVVLHQDQFIGFITRADLINHFISTPIL